jgi:hypothetical protein
MRLKSKVEQLEARLGRIELSMALHNAEHVREKSKSRKLKFPCPLCNGKTVKSKTHLGNRICSQQFGACGESWGYIPSKQSGIFHRPVNKPEAFYRRTVSKNGKVILGGLAPHYKTLYRVFFVSGNQVRKEQYDPRYW